MSYQEINKAVYEIKNAIKKEYKTCNYENVLKLIYLCSHILYATNYCYVDEDLERLIEELSEILVERVDKYEGNNDIALFWDGFGLNSRGLAQIYIKALVKHKIVVYVTFEGYKNRIPDIIQILNENGGCCRFIKEDKYVNQIIQLEEIVKEVRPGHFFFYSKPNDVVAPLIMHRYAGRIRRYQINLTDHAYWLAARPIDVCIEFRNYGANISLKERKIEQKKIRIIPYYPIINFNSAFQGYPFDFDENSQKLVFSGGALYKTMGGQNQYYKIVEAILKKHNDVVFWYAGNGNRSKMDVLIKKYPNRVFLTDERQDLYQVMQRCRIYLSTYPMGGGLMLQYACAAGKVPVTLRFGTVTDGILINQDKLGVLFDRVEELMEETDRLLTDERYALEKGELMKQSVPSEQQFTNELGKVLIDEKGEYSICITDVDSREFRQQFWNRFDKKRIDRLFLNKKNFAVYLKYFKKRIGLGLFYAVCEEMKRRICSMNQGKYKK